MPIRITSETSLAVNPFGGATYALKFGTLVSEDTARAIAAGLADRVAGSVKDRLAEHAAARPDMRREHLEAELRDCTQAIVAAASARRAAICDKLAAVLTDDVLKELAEADATIRLLQHGGGELPASKLIGHLVTDRPSVRTPGPTLA